VQRENPKGGSLYLRRRKKEKNTCGWEARRGGRLRWKFEKGVIGGGEVGMKRNEPLKKIGGHTKGDNVPSRVNQGAARR